MEFRILGPVEIWEAGLRHDLGSPKQACVLANLLLTPGRPVSAETLIDHVWGADPPAKVRGSLWSYIARLRRILAGHAEARLASRSGLYVLEAASESIDLHRFRSLRAQARALSVSGEREHAARLLREADLLWNGEALAGLPGDWARRTRTALEHERLAAAIDRVELDLALGKESELTGELSELISRHPFDERLVEIQMVALYRTGRQAEAMEAYRQARERLRDDLGAEPGPGLRGLHQKILLADPELAAPARGWAGRAAGPNNLPRDISYFTGRADELNTLAEAIVTGQAGTAITIVAIDGMAGVGKSTLAVHLAHLLAGQFPDGLIYVDLHAHDPYEEPIDPAAALDTLLPVAGTVGTDLLAEPRRKPSTLDMHAALWRKQVAGRRMLIVLDDAGSRDQVGPLLPGTPGCLVLITSRRRLTGLAGAISLSLNVMGAQDATELFARVVGPERSHDADAIAEVVRLCGHMPLAIQLAASRLRHRPAWTAANLAQLLGRTQHLLREIRGEELEVAASFELSYRYLPRSQQTAFRQVGCYPGPDFSLHAAAAASGLPVAETDRVLSGLLDYHMLEEPVHGRFRCHVLLREYAAELSLRDESLPIRRVTTHRLLDYYLHVAASADSVAFPHRRRLAVAATYVPAEPPRFAGRQDALAWIATERQNILGAVQYAAANGFSAHVTLLPHVIAAFLEVGGHWADAATAHDYALEAWRRLGDRRGEAQAHADLCLPRLRAGHVDDALEHGAQALVLFRLLGIDAGAADALDRIGQVHWQAARYPDALAHFEESLAIHRTTGNRHGEAEVLSHTGVVSWHLGRYADAQGAFEQALELCRGIGDVMGEGKMLNNIGDVEQSLGSYSAALAHYEQALPIAREGNRQAEAVLLNNIGNAQRNLGRYDSALVNLRDALRIYREIGDCRCEADTLNNIGTTFQRMHRSDESLAHYQKALTIARTLSENYEAAHALRSMGDVYHHLGKDALALDHYEQALALSRRIGDPYEEACSLDGLGNATRRTQDEQAARPYWRAALYLFERIGVPEAAIVRSRLDPQLPAR